MYKAIFLKDGVYVTVETENLSNYEAKANAVIWRGDSYETNLQLGGRVSIEVWKDDVSLHVDGIPIVNSQGENDHSLEKITSYLNAMAANGVDTFITHYKNVIEDYYNNLKEQSQNMYSNINSSENLDNSDLINQLKSIMEKMTIFVGIIFALNVWMPANLDNQKVIDIADSIIETYHR